MTAVIIILSGLLLIGCFGSFCVGFWFGCRAEIRQLRGIYSVVNTSRGPQNSAFGRAE